MPQAPASLGPRFRTPGSDGVGQCLGTCNVHTVCHSALMWECVEWVVQWFGSPILTHWQSQMAHAPISSKLGSPLPHPWQGWSGAVPGDPQCSHCVPFCTDEGMWGMGGATDLIFKLDSLAKPNGPLPKLQQAWVPVSAPLAVMEWGSAWGPTMFTLCAILH